MSNDLQETLHSFEVKSSKGDTTYVVTIFKNGAGHCTCPAYKYCKTLPATCKHIKMVDEDMVQTHKEEDRIENWVNNLRS